MKKTLLCLLFLLFSNLFYAQITPLPGCQTYPIFNLTIKNAELIGNLNSNETTVSYHLSLDEAVNNTSPILNPTAFDSPQSKTIYARIENNGTVKTNSFQLIFYPQPQIVALHESPNCQESRTRIQLVSVFPGASQNFLYSLDYGQTYNFNMPFYLEPGNYTILIKDSYNCKTDMPVFIEVLPYRPLVANATVTEGINCGDKDVVTITATGGAIGYTYSFDGTNYSNLNTSSELKAGNYNVFVKDQYGCIASIPIKVNNYKASLTSILSVTPITCANNKGSITAHGFGGKLPYEYSLNGGDYQDSNTFDNLSAGNYTINTKDASGCVSSFVAVIFPFTPLSALITATSVSCNGQKDGILEVNATGGSGSSYSYALKNISGTVLTDFQSTNIFKDLSPGVYVVEIKDDTECMFSSLSVEIKEPTVLTSTVKVENQTIKIDATGGSGKYLYSLDYANRQPSNVFENIPFGDHKVYVLDENGCVNLMYFSVVPPAPLIDGKNILNIEFKPGQTLGDLILNILNIKWYSTPGSSTTGKTSISTAETPLPLSTVLVDGVTYYASQTIDGVESKERLAVTAKVSGSLSTPDFELADFNFYPNPVKHILTIKNKSAIEDLQIFAVSGQSVLFQKIDNTHAEIDLSNLSKGMYILKVKSDGKEKAMKFIKE